MLAYLQLLFLVASDPLLQLIHHRFQLHTFLLEILGLRQVFVCDFVLLLLKVQLGADKFFVFLR